MLQISSDKSWITLKTAYPKKGLNNYNVRALNEWANTNRADPWLVAVAKAKGHTLITFERSNYALGTSTSSHPKIPDVAAFFNVKCKNLFYMMRALKFNFK
jgi:hypothetical protein